MALFSFVALGANAGNNQQNSIYMESWGSSDFAHFYLIKLYSGKKPKAKI